jgi:predicted choloylglycine hydrolase
LSFLRHSARFQSTTQRSLCTNHTQVITVHSRTLARQTKTNPKPNQCPKNN